MGASSLLLALPHLHAQEVGRRRANRRYRRLGLPFVSAHKRDRQPVGRKRRCVQLQRAMNHCYKNATSMTGNRYQFAAAQSVANSILIVIAPYGSHFYKWSCGSDIRNCKFL